MKLVSELKAGDYIAFGFSYNGGKANEIMVTGITGIHKGAFIVHFLYGHHSMSELIKQEDVLAIGNTNGETKIKGWSGKFDLINSEHPLILKNTKTELKK